jgi:thioredoxin reductase (NADPH)
MNLTNLTTVEIENQKKKVYDIAIVGAGPAGLTAAVYALRDNKNVILFEKNIEGGQVLSTPKIDNIPGFYGISGQHFINLMGCQIQSIVEAGFGSIDMEYSEVVDVSGMVLTDGVVVHTLKTEDDDWFCAQKVIFATGNKNRTLGVPGEKELIGNGICFCVTCDGPFYKDKDVAVIGGGNSALTEALELSKYVNHVMILQDLHELTAERSLIEEVKKTKNIDILVDCKVLAFTQRYNPQDSSSKIVVELPNYLSLAVDGVFEAIGFVPDNDVAKNVYDIDENGYLVNLQGTSGVFAAGDCRAKMHRQIVLACADGAEAAIKACQQLNQGVKFVQ